MPDTSSGHGKSRKVHDIRRAHPGVLESRLAVQRSQAVCLRGHDSGLDRFQRIKRIHEATGPATNPVASSNPPY